MSGISQILIVLQNMTISSSQNSSELKVVELQVVVWFGFMVHFEQYFSYIVAVSFIGGGNWSTRRKPPITDKLYHIMLYTSP